MRSSSLGVGVRTTGSSSSLEVGVPSTKYAPFLVAHRAVEEVAPVAVAPAVAVAAAVLGVTAVKAAEAVLTAVASRRSPGRAVAPPRRRLSTNSLTPACGALHIFPFPAFGLSVGSPETSSPSWPLPFG
eukprot:CAMPEP_0171137306 /NCGR_PEP_ID=MMETSP0766_2-20121228/133133_1 /TAXON_ID=439317 /ORGANISM="Gambierdiscus australes, Strain CAWD 149" /LENGTH=128 /DNA_ID=CAMNT_0011600887 /DNA_START=196 /DNA_END=583 /DNA_ORIENTATION=+